MVAVPPVERLALGAGYRSTRHGHCFVGNKPHTTVQTRTLKIPGFTTKDMEAVSHVDQTVTV